MARVETLKKSDYEEDRQSGNPEYNRCWPVTQIFRELYTKHSKVDKLEEKDQNMQQEKEKEQKEEENEDLEPITSELKSLKAQCPNKYLSKCVSLEREVMFLFKEFDDENAFLQQDAKLRDNRKILADLQNAQKENPTDSSLYEKFYTEDQPELMKSVKNMTEKAKSSSGKKSKLDNDAENPIFVEDMDEELALILKGELKIKSYKGIEQGKCSYKFDTK